MGLVANFIRFPAVHSAII